MIPTRCRWRSYALYPSDVSKLGLLSAQLGIPDHSKALRHCILLHAGRLPSPTYVGPHIGAYGKAERGVLHNLSLSSVDVNALEAVRSAGNLRNLSQAVRLVIRETWTRTLTVCSREAV